MRPIIWLLYSLIAKYLPRSSRPLGFIGKRARGVLCKRLFRAAGRDINIERGADFGSGRTIVIGNRSGIGIDCILAGEIEIGDDVMMGPRCYLVARNHEFKDTSRPMNQQGYSSPRPIIIENDVWIGACVVITGGVVVGTGSILAAGAVVTKSVEPLSIVGGNPARQIGKRGQ